MRTKLLSFLKLYQEELSLFLWTTALLFIIRSSGIILSNYTETAFLKRYGVEYLPIVNMLNAVATFFITGFLAVIMGKLPTAKLLSCVFIFSGISVTCIRLLIPFEFELLYPLLFMLKSQFEIFQALLFWNICNDIFDTRQSKRLFPLLTAGGMIGLILGSFGTPYFAKLFQMDNLLYLYLGTTVVGALIVQTMGSNFPSLISSEKKQHNINKKPPMIEEFKNVLPLIKKSVLLKILLVLTFMPNVVIPIMNYQFNYSVNDQFATEAQMILFFGYFKGILYTVSLFILLFVGRIYGKWGLPVALMFHPFNYMIAFLGFLFNFNFFSAMYARMSTNILRSTINMPTYNILFGLFPESFRGMIRPFLRGTVVRLALFLGSGLILLSENLFHPRYLSLVAMPFILAWLAAPIILKFKYHKILMDLISESFQDIKSMSQKTLGRAFKDEKLSLKLKQNFLSARGKDAIWYGNLLKSVSTQDLDQKVLEALKDQDDKTRADLIKMLSPHSLKTSMETLTQFITPESPKVTIALFRNFLLQGTNSIKSGELSCYVSNSHPVVRGFAAACLYSENNLQYSSLTDKWLTSKNRDELQAGIVSAGLSGKEAYIDILLGILSRKNNDAIIPDLILALSRLKAMELNSIAYSYFSHGNKKVRMAALNAFTINSHVSLKKSILLLADSSDSIQERAIEKIKKSPYHNSAILVDSLGVSCTRTRRGLFKLLEALDSKDLDVSMFARKNISKCYAYLAMSENIKKQSHGKMWDLAVEHMVHQKELVLENILRILAITDQTGKMETVWKGFLSPDTRQKAYSIELLNDFMDDKLFNAMRPLLESPTPARALIEGMTVTVIPTLDPDGKQVFSTLLSSEDWVDVIMAIGLCDDAPWLMEDSELFKELKKSNNKNISKEVQRIQMKNSIESNTPQEKMPAELPLGEKILHLKEFKIFQGLSPAQLAAIAAVTQELNFPEKSTVIKQNDVGDAIFLIIEGKVEVIKELKDNEEMMITTIGKSDCFGEMALLDSELRSATIRTTEPCRFLTIQQQEFRQTTLEFPGIALEIGKILSRRIRSFDSEIQN